jgi:hypothetical protein
MALTKDQATFAEKSTPTYFGQLERADRVTRFGKVEVEYTPLYLQDISTITLTYYNAESEAIINSRDGQDVKNTNNVTIGARGDLTWELQQADTVIVDSTLSHGKLEKHIARFDITTVTSKVFRKEVELWIRQFLKVS